MDIGPMHGLTLLVYAAGLIAAALLVFVVFTMVALPLRALGHRRREALWPGALGGGPLAVLGCLALLLPHDANTVTFVEMAAAPTLLVGLVRGVRAVFSLRVPLPEFT